MSRNATAFALGQSRHDNACPAEDDENGWSQCDECNGCGCTNCKGEGGGTPTEAMSLSEYLRRERRAREDALSY